MLHKKYIQIINPLIPPFPLAVFRKKGCRKKSTRCLEIQGGSSQHYPNVLPSSDPGCLSLKRKNSVLFGAINLQASFPALSWWIWKSWNTGLYPESVKIFQVCSLSNEEITYSPYNRLLDYKTKIRNFASSDTPRQSARFSPQIPHELQAWHL